MRRWHKLLAPWFALLLFAIALTGAVTQTTALLDTSTAKAAMAATGAKDPVAAAVGKRSAIGAWNHWFKKLHSGEALGPAGIALNLTAGLALLFFAGSGFWMYLTMWLRLRRNRRSRAR